MAADRVTDAMVAAALKAWQETNVTFGDLHSLMRAAIEAALRAEAGAVGDEDEFAVKVLSVFLVDWDITPDDHKTALTGFMRDAIAQARRTDAP